MAFDPISAAFEAVKPVITHFLPDPVAQAQAMAALEKQRADSYLTLTQQQADVNKVEAASTNWFVAGWRPWVGWVCGLGLFSQFIVRPFVIWGSAIAGHPTDFPSLDMGTLVTLLGGMLGLTAARTYEKVNDAAGNH